MRPLPAALPTTLPTTLDLLVGPNTSLADITCVAPGGNWSSGATWSGGEVPTAADNVAITNGCTVTIDTAAVALDLIVMPGGTLEFEETTARTLTLGGNATVAGTFRSAAAGVQTGHMLSLAGHLTNVGTIDFSTNGNSAGANITFAGAGSTVWVNDAGSSTNVRTAILNKGTSAASGVQFSPGGTFTVQGANTSGFLTIANGTFAIMGNGAFANPVFAATTYTIPATGAFWLDNANATVTGQAGSPTNNGVLRVSEGTLNVGTLGTHVMGAGIGASFNFDGGGTTNFAGRLNSTQTFITYTQSSGSVNICVAGGCTTAPSFGFSGATGVVTKISGGSINLFQANTATTPVDYNQTGTMVYTGGTLNVGTAATTTNFTFRVQGQTPNVVVDNTTANKTMNLSGQLNVWGNLTINSGAIVNVNPGTAQTLLQIGPAIVNNGAIVTNVNNTGTVNFAGSLQALTSYAQSYIGTGTLGTGAVRLSTLSIQNAPGVTIDSSVSTLNVNRINAFYGGVTNANKIGVGQGDAIPLVIQRGATGIAFHGGSLDLSPTFNIGAGGLTLVYSQSQGLMTTGPEIPVTRTVLSIQIIAPDGVTLLGGDLTSTGTTNGLLLSSGALDTTSHRLILTGTTVTAVTGGSAASYVRGPLVRTLPASLLTGSTYTFPVGKGSFKMLELVNPTTNAGGTVTIEAEVFDYDSGGSAGGGFDALNTNRYWSALLTGGAANFTNATVRLTEQGTATANAIGQSATQLGAYDSIGGAVTGAAIGPSNTVTTLGYFAVGRLTGSSTIAGPYTVGTGGDFATLTAAVAALNSRVMTGPVTFVLTDDTYAGETFPITINANGGNSATNTLTIKPASGASPVFSGTSASALIVLNGIDHVTIDGSNSGGGTRDMTLTNNAVGATTAVLWGQTTGTANPTTNNTIKNLNLSGNASTTTLAGVGFGSTTISAITAGTRNDNNRIQNNSVTTTQFGVLSQGAQSAAKNVGTVITGNTLGGNGAAALGRAGVYVGFEDGVQVTNNNVLNVNSAVAGSDVFGIALGSIAIAGSGFTTNNDVANATVTGNFIGSVLQTVTYSAAGISSGTPNYGTTRIANNSISGVSSNGTAGRLHRGHLRGVGRHPLRHDGALLQLGLDDGRPRRRRERHHG